MKEQNNLKQNNELDEISALLKQSDLDFDIRIANIIHKNPRAKKSLIHLFQLLKTHHIPLNDSLYDAIEKNVSKISLIVDLLKSQKLTKEKIEWQEIPLGNLLTTPIPDERVLTAAWELDKHYCLNSMGVKMITTYPLSALRLSEFMIQLNQEYPYAIEQVEKTFAQLPTEYLNSVLNLLIFAAEKNQFYKGLFAIVLKDPQYVDIIYQGANTLNGGGICLSAYFEIIKNNPSNASITAKILLLLDQASLIDHGNKEALLTISQFGLGVLFFLKYLSAENMLNTDTYKTINQHHSFLDSEKMITNFQNILLFETFSKNELNALLNCMNQASMTENNENAFIKIINHHTYQSISDDGGVHLSPKK